MNYRNETKCLVYEARENLQKEDKASLRSAALSLRMAMEALAYERVKLYRDDLPPEDYKKWQPRILMKCLVDIDPYADKSGSVSYGIEPSLGEKPKEMKFLGTENVLDLATIKKHYDALGSYLHMPTIQQLENKKLPNQTKLRAKCEAVASAIEKALSSPIWNVNFKLSSELDCLECSEPIRRRFREGSKSREVQCFNCDASYTMSEAEDGKVHWEPHQKVQPCPSKGCEGSIPLWHHEIARGTSWKCSDCNQRFIIDLAVLSFQNNSPKDKD